MLFDIPHILYMVISAIITACILVAAAFLIKTKKGKESFLRFWALATVFIHYSSIYSDYYIGKVKNPELGLSMFIPAYACNVCMWLLLIVAFSNRKNKFISLVSHFVALGGIVCGVVGILLNENYGAFAASNPGMHPMQDFEVVKGLLSHSTMLLGCIYLLVCDFVRVRVKTTPLGVTIGLAILFVDGLIVNGLNTVFGMPDVNSMYLHAVPFEKMPWLNTLTIGIVGVTAAFVISVLAEQFTLPKHRRWYSKIKAPEIESEQMEETVND